MLIQINKAYRWLIPFSFQSRVDSLNYLLVDTGANCSMITTGFIKRSIGHYANYVDSIEPNISVRTADGRYFKVALLNLRNVVIGDFELPLFKCYLHNTERAGSILGMDFLTACTTHTDKDMLSLVNFDYNKYINNLSNIYKGIAVEINAMQSMLKPQVVGSYVPPTFVPGVSKYDAKEREKLLSAAIKLFDLPPNIQVETQNYLLNTLDDNSFASAGLLEKSVHEHLKFNYNPKYLKPYETLKSMRSKQDLLPAIKDRISSILGEVLKTDVIITDSFVNNVLHSVPTSALEYPDDELYNAVIAYVKVALSPDKLKV